MTTGDNHIADQPELLEDFVLEQLPSEEMEIISAHVNSCPDCAAAVRSERLLVAAIRRSGRDTRKELLKENLLAEDRSLRVAVPWSRIVGIAAGIVVLVGLGVAGRWIFLRQTPTSVTAPAVATTPAPEQKEFAQEAGKEIARAKDAPAAQKPDNREITLKKSSDNLPGARSEPVEALALQQDSERPAESPAVNRLDAAKNEGVWTEATENAGAPRAVSESTNRMTRSVGTMKGLALSPYRRKISVFLRPLSPSVAGSYRKRDTQALPAMIVKDSTTVRITLYLPPQDSLMQQASPYARWAGDDSVVITVGRTEFGLNIRPKE